MTGVVSDDASLERRKCLTIVLHEKAFGPEDALGSGRAGMSAGTAAAQGRISPLISWGAMERIYPRYPTIGSVRLTEEERRGWIDLRPYVNTAPYVINGGFPRCVETARRCVLSSVAWDGIYHGWGPRLEIDGSFANVGEGRGSRPCVLTWRSVDLMPRGILYASVLVCLDLQSCFDPGHFHSILRT